MNGALLVINARYSSIKFCGYEVAPSGEPYHFDDLLEPAAKRAPAKRLVNIEDVGVAVALLATITQA